MSAASSARRIRLCPVVEVAPGQIVKQELPDGSAVALYNIDGAIHATADRCTHGDASLSEEGSIVGVQVECSWHFGTFDIASGRPTGMPCTEALRVYPVSIIDGIVHVEL